MDSGTDRPTGGDRDPGPPAEAPNRNILWARALLQELARSGVEHVCLAPGSRSTPLVVAAHDQPTLTVHTQLDERSAAFLALGIGKATGRPAVVITTSGTATANLHPAVIEASQSRGPLIVLTADRPHRLRGNDANQSIDQIKLYGDTVRAFHEVSPPIIDGPNLRHLRQTACRAVAQATGPQAGPVHLNLPFEKPLEPVHVPGDIPEGFGTDHPLAVHGRPDGGPWLTVDQPPTPAAPPQLDALAQRCQASRKGLIVAGPHPDPERLGPAVLALAEATGFPVIADPLSGARFCPGAEELVVAHSDLILQSPAAREHLAPDLVLRVGASPTSQATIDHLAYHQGTPQIIVDDGPRMLDHRSVATDELRAEAPATLTALAERLTPTASEPWRQAWQQVSQVATKLCQAAHAEGTLEGTILARTAEALPSGAGLFVSNSMPVRDLDAFGAPRDEPLTVLGHRGASGIDGIVSTATGMALATDGPHAAVLGDLALIHDQNGLLTVRDEQPDLTFIVVNNDGGGIFHKLPISGFDPPFTEHFATPHGLDPARIADVFELEHQALDGPAALRSALESGWKAGGPRLIEVATDREATHEARARLEAKVRAAIDDHIPRGGSP